MAFKFPWPAKDSHRDDPFWDFFVNSAPADRANTVIELMRNAPAGNIFPTKAELHTPEITATHVKGMAEYFGAELTGIAKLDSEAADDAERYPLAILCAVHADYDPRVAKGIGGQMPVQNGLFVTFVLSAWIRELGFRAVARNDGNSNRLAAKAGLGTLDIEGRLITAKHGRNIYVADVIYTDLPMAADG